jgi:hypothetical protein
VFFGAAAAAGLAYVIGERNARPEPTPAFRASLDKLLDMLDHMSIPVKVGQVGRTLAEQEQAAEKGRTATLQSKHLTAQAVDIYPLDPDTGQPDFEGKHLDTYRKMHQIAVALGWRSIAFNPDGSKRILTAANGKQFWDGAHLEWTPASAR